MRDELEGCADCGAPDKAYTRRQALKVGALSLGGAVVAAMLPGRVRADGFFPVCGRPGNCSTGFPQCGGSGVGLGCNCFTTAEGNGVCGANDYCGNLPTDCTKSTDCPFGYFCSMYNGCTGCGAQTGVCVKGCRPSTAARPRTPAKSGQMTATGVRH